MSADYSKEYWEQIEKIIGDEEKARAVKRILKEAERTRQLSQAQRQAEGIAAAKSRGVKFGRPPKPITKKFIRLYKNYRSGGLTVTDAAKMLGVTRASFKAMAERYERECAKESDSPVK